MDSTPGLWLLLLIVTFEKNCVAEETRGYTYIVALDLHVMTAITALSVLRLLLKREIVRRNIRLDVA